MPKIPKAKDFVKNLQKIGFDIVRQKGSHVIMKKDKIIITVPVHSSEQLKLGLFKNLIKIININEKEYWDI